MRETLFRGKRKDNYKQVEGFFARYKKRTYIFGMVNEITVNWHEVIPDTVGQYTGLTDKNDKRIFEGDVVKCKHFYEDYDGTFEHAIIRNAYGKTFNKETCESTYMRNYVVRMYNGSWEIRNGSDGHKINCNYILNHDIEVIGNIHDNPELIKEYIHGK